MTSELAAAVVLRHYHGYNNREIAAALGVSERPIGARLAQATAHLRDMLAARSEVELPTLQRQRVEKSVILSGNQ